MPLATRRDIGQFLIGSMPGTTIPAELRSLAREFDLGGVILFSRNIEAPEQVAELAAESEALGRSAPAWVSVDQEGGRVARLKEPFTKWPPMATLGRAGTQAERAGRFGLAATITERVRNEETRWIELELNGEESQALELLQEPGRISRLEQRECGAAAGI